MGLSDGHIMLLRAPLPLVNGHSARVGREAGEWAIWLIYTEEEPVIDRLNEVDPNWSFEITDKIVPTNNCATVYGRLTVCGVSRDCVGSGAGGDAEKGAATDALKRGARMFGVGLYLKNTPTIMTKWEPDKQKRKHKQEDEWRREALNKFAAWYVQQNGQSEHEPVQPEPVHDRTRDTASELDEYFPRDETPTVTQDAANEYHPANDTNPFDQQGNTRFVNWMIRSYPPVKNSRSQAAAAILKAARENGIIRSDESWPALYAEEVPVSTVFEAIEKHYAPKEKEEKS